MHLKSIFCMPNMYHTTQKSKHRHMPVCAKVFVMENKISNSSHTQFIELNFGISISQKGYFSTSSLRAMSLPPSI